MPTRIVQITDSEGLTVGYAEVAVPEHGDVGLRSHLPDISYTELKKQINSVAALFSKEMRENMPNEPDAVSVELGCKLSLETGKIVGVLAQVAAEANITIRMEWNRKENREAQE